MKIWSQFPIALQQIRSKTKLINPKQAITNQILTDIERKYSVGAIKG
jgi:hypothetical protein